MRTQKLDIRGLQIHIQEWGKVNSPKLLFVHGWMDCGASFKHLMPKLTQYFHVIAPDLRGFGESEHDPTGYWFPDYLADLDEIIHHVCPNEKINIVGHSMGGNIALMYAGIKTDKVNKVMSLEGIGLPATTPKDALSKYQQWMQQTILAEPTKVYPNSTALKNSIRQVNPSLSEDVILELVDLWGKPLDEKGAYILKHDHKHRNANPIRYNFADILEIWKAVEAETALVMATDSIFYNKLGQQDDRLLKMKETLNIKAEHYYEIHNCNHMLHLEQPEVTADIVIDFFLT